MVGASGLDQPHGLKRAVNHKTGIMLDLLRIGQIKMDPVRIEGDRGIAEQQRLGSGLRQMQVGLFGHRALGGGAKFIGDGKIDDILLLFDHKRATRVDLVIDSDKDHFAGLPVLFLHPRNGRENS